MTLKTLPFVAALCAAIFAVGAAAAGTSLTFYEGRATFDAAEPGLPVQSFDRANLHGQPYVIIPNNIDAATSDGVFQPGDILPGLAIGAKHPGRRSSALIVYQGGPVNGVSVGQNWYGDTLILNFSPAVSAVGETVFANTSNGTSFAGKIHEDVYGGAGRLGGRTVTEAVGGRAFIGVSAPVATITRVEISWGSDSDATTYVSKIAFGGP